MINTSMIVKRPALYNSFKKELLSKKAIYISGPTGWGKTTAVIDWLNSTHKSYAYLSTTQEDFVEAIASVSHKIIVIDDLHTLSHSPNEQLIINALTTLPKSSFILIGRCALPAYLKPFHLTAQLTCYDGKDLKLDREQISDLLNLYKLTDSTLPAQIEKVAKGYPMSTYFVINRLTKGEPMGDQLIEEARIDTFDCYDEIVFKHWDADLQKFLLHMAPFECFTEKMAGMITGKKNIIAIIEKALWVGSYLTFVPPDTYSIHPLFHQYLMRKQHLECSKDFVYSTYHNAGLYYELEDDIGNALKYYQLSEDTDKISELLILNSQRHPGNGHYYETVTFYRALPKETILNSIELMCGMCMLCSLHCQVEESEYWFGELERFSEKLDKHDKRYKLAQGKLCYLKIALPHRGSKNITSILLDVAKAYSTGAFQLQEFSVTSNLPSVLNGGKDFCKWTLHDKQLYKLMKKPCELLLGRYGVGLADVCLAESQFEKCSTNSLTEVMMLANSGLNAAAFKGTLEVEFAATAVLTNIMVIQNNIPSAIEQLASIKSKADKTTPSGLSNNLDAFCALLELLQDKTTKVTSWLNNNSPNEKQAFRIMDRYRYLVKVRCYLKQEKNIDALQLLIRLLDYFRRYDRTYCQMQAGVLLAITQYRMSQEGWIKTLDDALLLCQQYNFIRVVAAEGAALLPLLQKATLSVNPDYAKQLLEETRHYALLYPNYLKPQQKLIEPLTDTEKSVLRLLCKGLTNDEIAEMMAVSISTIKFHTSNLYAKMNVKGRIQAIQKASDLL